MSSGPSVPSAQSVSQAQTASNKDTAIAQAGLNSTNQQTPFGNLTYSQIGTWPDGTPRFQATTTLNPQLQSLFTTGVGTQQQIGNTAQNLASQLPGQLQTLNQPQLQNVNGNFDDVRQQTQDALLGRLNDQSGRDLTSLQQNLANQGIQQGSEAYTNAMKDYNLQLSDNRTNALLASNQAQQQAQDLAQSAVGFNNQNAQNTFANQATANSQNINQLLSLLGGSQINSSPQFQSTPQTGISGTDVAGNAWNAYGAQQNQSNQFWNGLGAVGSGIGSLAGSTAPYWAPLLFASDEKLKTDIHDTGMKTPGGVPIKDWRYKGSPMMHRGFIAQDVQKKQPEAVARIKTPKGGGFLAVDYRRVA